MYAAVTATFVKRPADQSLLCDVQYLRELLDLQALRQIMWIDTRDMYADGLTKGAVHRSAHHAVMAGTMQLEHPFETWRSKGPISDMRAGMRQ